MTQVSLLSIPELSKTVSIKEHLGLELIPRNEIEVAAELIDRLGLEVIGIDAFCVHPDGKIQPSNENDFPNPNTKPCQDYVAENLPGTEDWITHFEVVI